MLNSSIQEAARLDPLPLGAVETRHDPQRDDEASPSDAHDVLVVTFRGKEHLIHFPQHDISDGKIKVRNLIRPVARTVSLSGRESRSLRFFDYSVESNSRFVAIVPEAGNLGRRLLRHRQRREHV